MFSWFKKKPKECDFAGSDVYRCFIAGLLAEADKKIAKLKEERDVFKASFDANYDALMQSYAKNERLQKEYDALMTMYQAEKAHNGWGCGGFLCGNGRCKVTANCRVIIRSDTNE